MTSGVEPDRMDTLSSCYFCNTALDESVDSHPLIDSPKSSSVVLCQSCRHKLEPLLDAVVEAAATGAVTAASADADGDALLARSNEADAAGTTRPSEDATAGGPDVDDGASSGAASEPAIEADESDLPPWDEAVGVVDGDEAPDTAGGPERTDGDDADQARAEANSSAGGADSATSADTDGNQPMSDDEASNAAGTRTTISALEYNRVMRLLQNREFPVDRDEILTVAANAYSLGREDCAEVIDLAIDRGLIEESEGQLTRPGD